MGLEKINEFKKMKNLTNKEISEITGISISSLDKITSGNNTNPKLETVKLICSALNCKLSDLIDDDQCEEFSFQESNIIKKYRVLDEHGKDMVDTVLDKEYSRCAEETSRIKAYTANMAAGTGSEGLNEKKIKEMEAFGKLVSEYENKSE